MPWNKFCMIIARWLYDNCQMALLEDLEVHNSYLITILAEEGPQPQIEKLPFRKNGKRKKLYQCRPNPPTLILNEIFNIFFLLDPINFLFWKLNFF